MLPAHSTVTTSTSSLTDTLQALGVMASITGLWIESLSDGADVVLNSLTKCLANHSDVVLNTTVATDEQLLTHFQQHIAHNLREHSGHTMT